MKIFYILSLIVFVRNIPCQNQYKKIQHVYCTVLNEVYFSHLKSSSLSFRQINVDQTVAPVKCQQLNEIKKRKSNQYLTYDSHAFFIELAWGPGVKSTTKQVEYWCGHLTAPYANVNMWHVVKKPLLHCKNEGKHLLEEKVLKLTDLEKWEWTG